MDIYEILGFNGCVGLIDCNHLHRDKCPREWQNFCIRKEGYPTLAVLVVMDHIKGAMTVRRDFQMCNIQITVNCNITQ